jgi:hypothetical protein
MDLTEEELAQRSMTCRHQLGLSHDENDTCAWLARMRVDFVHAAKGTRSLYTGHCEMVAEMELHPSVPEADRLKLVSLNAGAILYSATREWFATLSARSLHGMVELPTIDARCFLPKETPANPPATEAKPDA